MTTMLERAARALWDAREARLPEMLRTEWQAQPEAHETHRNFARAVLMAVREPDDDMKESAGWSDYDSGCWAEGIDAILGENK